METEGEVEAMPEDLECRHAAVLPAGSTFYCPWCEKPLLWNRVRMAVGTPFSLETVEAVGREPLKGDTPALCWHCGSHYGPAALDIGNWVPLYAEVVS